MLYGVKTTMAGRGSNFQFLRGMVLVAAALSIIGCSNDQDPVAPGDPCEASIVPVEDLDSPPVPISRSAPLFPWQARIDNWEGEVEVRLVLNKDGTVCSNSISTSSGRTDVDESVLEATQDWEYEPPMKDGNPVRTALETKCIFRVAP